MQARDRTPPLKEQERGEAAELERLSITSIVTGSAARGKEVGVTQEPPGFRLIPERDLDYINRLKTQHADLVALVAELLEASEEQSKAIDMLFAMLVERDRSFYPSRSGEPWDAAVNAVKVRNKARALTGQEAGS